MISRLMCSIFGHQYKRFEDQPSPVKKVWWYECERCGKKKTR